jgi:hypothetical protein
MRKGFGSKRTCQLETIVSLEELFSAARLLADCRNADSIDAARRPVNS